MHMPLVVTKAVLSSNPSTLPSNPHPPRKGRGVIILLTDYSIASNVLKGIPNKFVNTLEAQSEVNIWIIFYNKKNNIEIKEEN